MPEEKPQHFSPSNPFGSFSPYYDGLHGSKREAYLDGLLRGVKRWAKRYAYECGVGLVRRDPDPPIDPYNHNHSEFFENTG